MSTVMHISRPSLLSHVPVPLPGEHIAGYLRRLATLNRTSSLRSLTRLLEIVSLNPRSADAMWLRLAAGLCVSPQFLDCLRWPILPDTRRRWIVFLGQDVHESYLHFSDMRLCARCVEETDSLASIWSLKHITACHRHLTRLREACPGCGKQLKLHSHFCWTCSECRSDFRDGRDDPAQEHEVIIAAGLAAAISDDPVPAAVASRFPRAWSSASLQERLTTIEYLGRLVRLSANDSVPAHLKRQYELIGVDFHASSEDLRETTRIAAATLAHWPEAYEEILEALIDRNPAPTTSKPLLRRFSTMAGNYAIRGLKSRNGEDLSLLSTARLDFLQRRLNYRPGGRNLMHRFSKASAEGPRPDILSPPRVEQLLGTNVTGLRMLHKAGVLQPLDLGTRLLAWNSDRLETTALRLLLDTLARGVEHLAGYILSTGDGSAGDLERAQGLFRQVIELSSQTSGRRLDFDGGEREITTRYPGPAHLASLLLSAAGGIADAPLTRVPPPDGADPAFWSRWLAFRARATPFVWRNHRTAIERGFYQTGTSTVLVLPTGAGKTTVSVLKIAGTLARGKKVVFLAPTHALVDQLTDDLQALFPEDEFPLQVSGDFDSLLLDDEQLKDIEVMTPERCLAMLSFAPHAFTNVGLLVFDECHLLHPSKHKIGRALDSMLCLLAFQASVPDADLLLLSAMLKNSKELAEWVAELTGRPCQSIELLWKPSRQARGVVVYDQAVIAEIQTAAEVEQRRLNKAEGRRAAGLRKAAEAKLVARPWVLWGLQHNWKEAERSHGFSRVTDGELPLSGGIDRGEVWARPNSNKTAAAIARNASGTGLKTIVFVNTKADAVRTAADIAESLDTVGLVPAEERLLEAIAVELGDRRHAIFGEYGFAAVPHNASMLRLERKLAEDLFRRGSGARVIVATPTLAQGLNLPAELAILAGDRRSGDGGKREDLEAHELLNAAARAGRAGHLANGVVILIPEPIITFKSKKTLSRSLQKALESVLPEDDRCIKVADPLEVVLDRVMQGTLDDRDVRYTVNRLASLSAADGTTIKPGNLLLRSLAAFRARKRSEEQAYLRKARTLWSEALRVVEGGQDETVVLLASQSGVALDLLDRLRQRLLAGVGGLPRTVPGWLDWTLDWLKDDAAARADLLFDSRRSINAALGRPAPSVLEPPRLKRSSRSLPLGLMASRSMRLSGCSGAIPIARLRRACSSHAPASS